MQIKFIQSVYEAKRHLKVAQYLLEVTMKIMDDRRVLSKCLVELQKSATSIIDATLYLKLNVKEMPSGKDERAKLFFDKVGKKILEKQEIEELKKVLLFAKKHKEARLEFVKGEKLVIFGSENCRIVTEKGVSESITILDTIISKFEQKTQDINTPLTLKKFD